MHPGAVDAYTGVPLDADFIASASTTNAAQTTQTRLKTGGNERNKTNWGNCTETRLGRPSLSRERKLAEFLVLQDSEGSTVLRPYLSLAPSLEIQKTVPKRKNPSRADGFLP